MAKKKRTISAAGRRKLSRSLKARWALVKNAEVQNHAQTIPTEIVAACAGYVSHAIEEFARRSCVPSPLLAERVGELLRNKPGG